jgi:hypothetical protein
MLILQPFSALAVFFAEAGQSDRMVVAIRHWEYDQGGS